MNVSYLGPEGSFTQIALIDYFGNEAKQISERTIDDVFLSVQHQKVEYGIVPIENSFEGSVNNTHDLLIGSKLKIYDEVEIRIKQCLISRTSEINNINKIYSHPQSFAQCRKWLKNNLPEAELIPVLSNSEGAQKILSNNEACIGSNNLITLYGLELISENIEDSPDNITRFIILSYKQQEKKANNKVSLLISAPNTDASGSLYNLLAPFASQEINLLRIESRPHIGKLWSYVFFVDCEGHIEDSNIKDVIDTLKKQEINVQILGCYPTHK